MRRKYRIRRGKLRKLKKDINMSHIALSLDSNDRCRGLPISCKSVPIPIEELFNQLSNDMKDYFEFGIVPPDAEVYQYVNGKYVRVVDDLQLIMEDVEK